MFLPGPVHSGSDPPPCVRVTGTLLSHLVHMSGDHREGWPSAFPGWHRWSEVPQALGWGGWMGTNINVSTPQPRDLGPRPPRLCVGFSFEGVFCSAFLIKQVGGWGHITYNAAQTVLDEAGLKTHTCPPPFTPHGLQPPAPSHRAEGPLAVSGGAAARCWGNRSQPFLSHLWTGAPSEQALGQALPENLGPHVSVFWDLSKSHTDFTTVIAETSEESSDPAKPSLVFLIGSASLFPGAARQEGSVGNVCVE